MDESARAPNSCASVTVSERATNGEAFYIQLSRDKAEHQITTVKPARAIVPDPRR